MRLELAEALLSVLRGVPRGDDAVPTPLPSMGNSPPPPHG